MSFLLLIISFLNVVVGLYHCFTAEDKGGWIFGVLGWLVVIIAREFGDHIPRQKLLFLKDKKDIRIIK